MFFKTHFFVSVISACALCQPLFCSQEQGQPMSRVAIKNVAAILQRMSQQIKPLSDKSVSIARYIFSAAKNFISAHPFALFGAGIAVGVVYALRARGYSTRRVMPSSYLGGAAYSVRTHAQRIVALPESHTYEKIFDEDYDQFGFVGPKKLYGTTCLALVPLPGQKIPNNIDLNKTLSFPPIDKDMAQRACQIYCAKNPLLNDMYNQLCQGKLIRTLIHGRTGVGKNFLSCALPQVSGYPYDVVEIAAPSLLSKWHNCQFEGIQEVLNQAVARYRVSNKKVILIIDNIDVLEDKEQSSCCGVPCCPWTDALHRFFDRQDLREQGACNVSVITLTDRLDYISESIKKRFTQILLEKPDKETRHAIITAFMAKYNHELDSSVYNYTQKLACMTEGLTPRYIEYIFSSASDRLLYPKVPNGKITWPIIEEETRRYIGLEK